MKISALIPCAMLELLYAQIKHHILASNTLDALRLFAIIIPTHKNIILLFSLVLKLCTVIMIKNSSLYQDTLEHLIAPKSVLIVIPSKAYILHLLIYLVSITAPDMVSVIMESASAMPLGAPLTAPQNSVIITVIIKDIVTQISPVAAILDTPDHFVAMESCRIHALNVVEDPVLEIPAYSVSLIISEF